MSVPLFSRVVGPSSGPVVFVAHGLCGSGRNWLSMADTLSQSGFCVHLLDLRDHGQSPWTKELSYPALADDLIAYWRSVGQPPFVFVGHSLGGKLGMSLATQYSPIFGLHLRGLCVVDIAPRAYQPPYLPWLIACRDLPLGSLASRAQADAALSTSITDTTFRQFLLTNLLRGDDGAFRWSCHFDLIVRCLDAVAANPLLPAHVSSLPALFIYGTLSSYVQPPTDLDLCLHHFPGGMFVALPAGHNVHIQAPAPFAQALLPWLGSLP